jgi:hypothetical protein
MDEPVALRKPSLLCSDVVMDLIGDNMASRIDEKHISPAYEFSRRIVVSNLVCRELHAEVSHFHVPAKAVSILLLLLRIRPKAEDLAGTLQVDWNGGFLLPR